MLKSSIGLKVIVAMTGIILYLFVIGHMVGNLQIFLGQGTLNTYAEKLHALPPLLWAVRIGLLLVATVHVLTTLWLAIQNRRARPQRYVRQEPIEAGLSSRTMVYTGLIVLAFVLYHLAHFTWRLTNPQYAALQDPLGRMDVYSMVVMAFRNHLIAGIYMVAMLVFGFHLNHALGSFFQTVGWSTTRLRTVWERVALIAAIVLVAGNISIPLSILLGVVRPAVGGM